MIPCNVTHQAPPSMEFSRQEYWSGLPFPSSGDLPNPGIEVMSSALQADSLPLNHQGSLQSVLACKNQPVVCLGKGPEKVLSPRGNPACRGAFGGRRKAVRDRLALQGAFPLDLGARPLCRRLRGRGCANCQRFLNVEL